LEKAFAILWAAAGHFGSIDEGEGNDSIAREVLSADVRAAENVQ
jgi:hypothetical protein